MDTTTERTRATRGVGMEHRFDHWESRMRRKIRLYKVLILLIALAAPALVYRWREILAWLSNIKQTQIQTWAPLISILIALTVFLWQAHTQRQKLRLDLFEKRLGIYEDLESILLKMISCSEVTEEDRNVILLRSLSRSRFLFDQDVESFVMDLIVRCEQYQKKWAEYEAMPDRKQQLYWSHENTSAWNDLNIYLYALISPYLSFVKHPSSTHPAWDFGRGIRAGTQDDI